MYQTDLSPVLMTLWVLADSWVQDIEPSNSGLSPLAPSPIVLCFDRGLAFARLSVLLCEPQKHTEKPPATQARMMQLEKSLCRDNDTETNCLCPQKFHHLQFHITVHQRMVSVTVSGCEDCVEAYPWSMASVMGQFALLGCSRAYANILG